MNECGAKTRGGGACKRPAMANGRCNLHGGKSTGGPLVAGGRHSKYLPQRLQARYQEALQDPELLSLNAEVAVIDTRLGELFQRLSGTETSLGWVKAHKLRQQEKVGGPDGIKAGQELDQLLEEGLVDTATWNEIGSLIEQRRKCAESEAKRLAQLDQFITAKQANVLIAAIIKLVTDNVDDAGTRARIAQGLVGLVNHGDSAGAAGGTGTRAVN